MELLVEVGAEDSYGMPVALPLRLKNGSEGQNVVPPEDSLDIREVGFLEIRACRRRLHLLIADAYIERRILWVHNDVCAIAAELTVDLVADIHADGEHGRCHRHAESHRNSCQQLAPLLPPKRLVKKAQEHERLLRESRDAR